MTESGEGARPRPRLADCLCAVGRVRSAVPRHPIPALLPFGGHVQAHWELAGNRLPGFLVKCVEAVEKRGKGKSRRAPSADLGPTSPCSLFPARPDQSGPWPCTGLTSVGIYRISGNMSDVQRLRQALNLGRFGAARQFFFFFLWWVGGVGGDGIAADPARDPRAPGWNGLSQTHRWIFSMKSSGMTST